MCNECDVNAKLSRATFGAGREKLRTEIAVNGQIIIHSFDSHGHGDHESRQVNLTLLETMDLIENLQARVKKQNKTEEKRMFTKEHYEAISGEIKSRYESPTNSQCEKDGVEKVAYDLAGMFDNDNPHFNIDKFITACGLP